MLSPHTDLAFTLAAERRAALAADAASRRLRREARSRYGHPVFRVGTRRKPDEPQACDTRSLPVVFGGG